MKVLFDGKALQAREHLNNERRLSKLITELKSVQCSVAFSSHESGKELSADELGNCNVLVVTTRYPKQFRYSPAEKKAITDFVCAGGGLLLMSNHGDWLGKNQHDTRQYDAELSSNFGVEIERTFFKHPLRRVPTTLFGPDLNVKHSIISGGSGNQPVRSIVINNCCSIVAIGGDCVASLPTSMVDKRNGKSPEGQSFAYALEASSGLSSESKGRVVIIADSGFIGTQCTTEPGPGFSHQGDNLQFVKNVVLWLGGELG